jgi:hypothetical protein
MARVSTNASIPNRPYSRPTPEYLNPPQGAWGSSVMPLITTRPDRICEATRRARWTSVPRTPACRPYLESLAIRSFRQETANLLDGIHLRGIDHIGGAESPRLLEPLRQAPSWHHSPLTTDCAVADERGQPTIGPNR